MWLPVVLGAIKLVSGGEAGHGKIERGSKVSTQSGADHPWRISLKSAQSACQPAILLLSSCFLLIFCPLHPAPHPFLNAPLMVRSLVVDHSDPPISYSGHWAALPAAHFTVEQNATATFNFNGKQPNSGFFLVTALIIPV